MMKVLHLLMSNKFSGAEKVACQIIEDCSNYEMAYCSPKGKIEEELRRRKINYIPLDKRNVKAIKKVVESYKPDIIHAHDYRASVLVSQIRFKGRLISHLHNNNPSIKRWGMKSLIYNLTVDKYDSVVLVSNAIYEEAVFRKKLEGKYSVLSNYVSIEEIIKKSEQENDNISDVIFVGRLEEPKNPIAFIDIIKGIREKVPDVTAIIVGDGSLKQECNKKIQEYSLEKNIQMIGYEQNPYKIMKNSKIVLMPSKWDGLPMVAIESMVLNKVVLARQVGGLKEIFKECEEILFDVNEEAEEKISELLRNNCEYEKIQKKLANIVHKFIDKDRWIKDLMKLYKGE